MNVQTINNFRNHLDNIILEECREEIVQVIAKICFPKHRLACEVTLYESIVAKLKNEFESELSQEVQKIFSKNRFEALKNEYCINKANEAAEEATNKAWNSLEKSKDIAPSKKKHCSIL